MFSNFKATKVKEQMDKSRFVPGDINGLLESPNN